MKKWKWPKRSFDPSSDLFLLLNLYITQAVTLAIAAVVLFFQRNNPLNALQLPVPATVFYWGAGFALVVLLGDMLLARWVPEDVADDGGVNDQLFAERPFWHIAVISLVVAFCEELLFRGAVQHAFGPYWTSILFAAIHVRYLRHWLMTGMVFGISYGLGWIYLQTGSLWTPIAAHFMIDFIMGCIIRIRRLQKGE